MISRMDRRFLLWIWSEVGHNIEQRIEYLKIYPTMALRPVEIVVGFKF